MTNSNTRIVVETLQAFALAHLEIDNATQFAHMCDAWLQNEAWAVLNMRDVCDEISDMLLMGAQTEVAYEAAIKRADTTRPDGAIARKFEI